MTINLHAGNTICFCGKNHISRDVLLTKARQAGLKVVGKLSGTVTVVVGRGMNPHAPSTMFKLAARNQLPMLNEDDFERCCDVMIADARSRTQDLVVFAQMQRIVAEGTHTAQRFVCTV